MCNTRTDNFYKLCQDAADLNFEIEKTAKSIPSEELACVHKNLSARRDFGAANIAAQYMPSPAPLGLDKEPVSA